MTWPVWQQRWRLLVLLAVVELGALAAPILMWTPLTRAELDLGLLLTSLSLTYSLVVTGWEKVRELLLFERTPTMGSNMLTPWCFAAAIMLPPNLAACVTMVASVGYWPSYRVTGHRLLYRFVYSVASATLAATACSVLTRLAMPAGAGLASAVGAWLVVGVGLIVLAMCAGGQFEGIRPMLQLRTHDMEFLTIGVAMAEYGLHALQLPLLWLSVPLVVLLQRHYAQAELRDRPDRLMREEAWLHVAQVVVEASDTVSIVRIDSADPAAARTVAMMQAGCDAIGSYGDGRGLAILLPDCPPQNADALARRLRSAMLVRKVPCSIAAAAKPRDGRRLDDLLAVSEAEMVAREAAGERSERPWLR
jgi:hypothetical protein